MAIAGSTPPPRTPFFGRSHESDALSRALETGARLVTVTGPSGMGKTRLARQVMARIATRFGGGAFFCDLSAARDGGELQAAVATALDIPQRQGPQLARAIAARGPLLLVLDNLEHVVQEAPGVVGPWLDHAAELQLLVTSLVPTRMEDEVLFELGPLEATDAVAFYLERASRAAAGRELPPIEREAVEPLVSRLDRIPLAIELAAARARILPPRALLSRIDERFELLQSDRAGRHGSLLRALRLSWDLLDPAERKALALASVFVGGFTLDAAEALLGVDTFALLDSLRAKALVQGTDADGLRFGLYESVREFAALKLEELGLRHEAIAGHAAWFVREGERQAILADGREAPAAARWLRAERDNLVAAHRRCRGELGDPEAATRAGLALAVILAKQGPPALEVDLLDSTLAAARQSGDPILLARALLARAVASKRHGALDETCRLLDEGLAVARAAGSRQDEGHLLAESGAVLARTGDLKRAEADLQAALRIATAIGDPLLEGQAHLMLGAVDEARGSLEASAEGFDRALRVFRRHGHLRREGVALLSLGAAWSGLARFRDARRVLQEAAEVFTRLESRASLADVWMNLGSVELTAGRLDESEEWSLRALAVEREIGNRRFEGLAIGNLGLVSLDRGEPLLAEQRLGEAVSILRESGERRYCAINLAFLSVAEALVGKLGEARDGFAEARSFFAECGDRPSLQMMDVLEGMLDLAEGRRFGGGEGAEAAACETGVRERLARARGDDVDLTESLFLSIRLVEKTLARRDFASTGRSTGVATGVPGDTPDARSLVIGPDAAWFELDGGERVNLARRGAVRRLLHGLVEQRLLAPAVGLGLDALFALGWPGQTIHPDAAATRVYTGIRTLRSLGLSRALLRHADGYLLDPGLSIGRSIGP